MQCQRCSAVSQLTGRRCKNQTCKYAKYCWIHTDVHFRVRIRPSARGADGLFTLADLPAEHKFDFTISGPEVHVNANENNNFIRVNDHSVDMTGTQTSIARYVQECKSSDEDCENNSEYRWNDGFELYSTADMKTGDEIRAARIQIDDAIETEFEEEEETESSDASDASDEDTLSPPDNGETKVHVETDLNNNTDPETDSEDVVALYDDTHISSHLYNTLRKRFTVPNDAFPYLSKQNCSFRIESISSTSHLINTFIIELEHQDIVFTIRKRIGQGAHGYVVRYKAMANNTILDGYYLIAKTMKVGTGESCLGPDLLSFIGKETNMMHIFNPGLTWESQGVTYCLIFMEYASCDLSDPYILKLPVPAKLYIFRSVYDVLSRCFQKNYYYLDLKLENVLIILTATECQIKLGDLGSFCMKRGYLPASYPPFLCLINKSQPLIPHELQNFTGGHIKPSGPDQMLHYLWYQYAVLLMQLFNFDVSSIRYNKTTNNAYLGNLREIMVQPRFPFASSSAIEIRCLIRDLITGTLGPGRRQIQMVLFRSQFIGPPERTALGVLNQLNMDHTLNGFWYIKHQYRIHGEKGVVISLVNQGTIKIQVGPHLNRGRKQLDLHRSYSRPIDNGPQWTNQIGDTLEVQIKPPPSRLNYSLWEGLPMTMEILDIPGSKLQICESGYSLTTFMATHILDFEDKRDILLHVLDHVTQLMAKGLYYFNLHTDTIFVSINEHGNRTLILGDMVPNNHSDIVCRKILFPPFMFPKGLEPGTFDIRKYNQPRILRHVTVLFWLQLLNPNIARESFHYSIMNRKRRDIGIRTIHMGIGDQDTISRYNDVIQMIYDTITVHK